MAHIKPVNKKKMSGPKLAATIVSLAILIGLVISLLAGSGLFVRAQKGASSENFTVNGSMMEYFTMSYYQNWYSNYYYYILLGYIKFDPNTPLDQQKETTTGKTYYDYFKDGATENVSRILKYCEAALVDPEFDFAKVEAEAEEQAKTSIKALKESAKANGMSFGSFVRQNFGQYVNENDLKKSIVLEYIASEYSQVMYDRIFDSMTDDRKTEFFNDNLKSFISAEYLYFSISQQHSPEKVDEKAYPQGKEDPAYKEAVEKAKEEARQKNELQKVADKEFIDKLATAKNAEEFKRMLLDYKYDDVFESAYETAVKNFVTADKPSEEEWKAFAAEIKQQVIDAVIAGKSDITEDEDENVEATADEETTEETKWEKAKKTLPASVITSLKSVITNATKTVSYDVSNDFGKFLFQGVKGEYGIEYDEDETKGESAKVNENFFEDKEFSESEKEAAEAEGKYTLTLYFVTEAAHRDELMLRNVGHILFQVDEKGETEGAFKTWDEAKAAAEKVLAEIQATAKDGVVEKDVFEGFANEHNNDANNFYEDVNKGDMVEEFEDWLFAATKVGEVGLVKTTYGYHIMFYNGETQPAWEFDAHAGATNEDLETWYKALPYNVEVNANIFKKFLAN